MYYLIAFCFTAPINKPYSVRVLNVKVNGTSVYVDWLHDINSNLKGVIRGFLICIWPTNGNENESQAKMFSTSCKRYHTFFDLDVNTNYTAVVHSFTTSVGPGSEPVTSRNEEGITIIYLKILF
jgi:hypothetical protein